uniref:TM2 domain containing 1 n=1 Tax=Equus caballus TaxID=9796 RepID=A0A9L0RGI8_HORSE
QPIFVRSPPQRSSQVTGRADSDRATSLSPRAACEPAGIPRPKPARTTQTSSCRASQAAPADGEAAASQLGASAARRAADRPRSLRPLQFSKTTPAGPALPPAGRTLPPTDPKINDATQEPVNCTNYTAHVPCFPAPNITCKDFGGNETHFTGREVGFFKPISCRNVNGYSYKVAVALSLFLGWLGADRFYLGYPALGLLKFCTVGFCGIGSLIDFILISMQDSSIREGDGFITTDVTKQRSGSIWSSQCLPPASQRVFRSPPESLFLLLQYFRASVLSA